MLLAVWGEQRPCYAVSLRRSQISCCETLCQSHLPASTNAACQSSLWSTRMALTSNHRTFKTCHKLCTHFFKIMPARSTQNRVLCHHLCWQVSSMSFFIMGLDSVTVGCLHPPLDPLVLPPTCCLRSPGSQPCNYHCTCGRQTHALSLTTGIGADTVTQGPLASDTDQAGHLGHSAIPPSQWHLPTLDSFFLSPRVPPQQQPWRSTTST